MYIGSAQNIRARLQDWKIGNRWPRTLPEFGHPDTIEIRTATDRKNLQHLTREARLVQRLRPPMNRTNWRSRK